MGKEIKMNPGLQDAQVQINPNDLEDVVCDKCECQTFEPAFLFKKFVSESFWAYGGNHSAKMCFIFLKDGG